MDFDFVENGTGPAILFLPVSYSSHSAWRGVQKALKGSYRTILTSLTGYGDTPEIRAGDDDDLDLITGFVTDVVDQVGEPVHLVGHSYGGFCVYASVLSDKVKPLSIVTFEGNPICCTNGDLPFSWAIDMQSMKDRFRAAIEAGESSKFSYSTVDHATNNTLYNNPRCQTYHRLEHRMFRFALQRMIRMC